MIRLAIIIALASLSCSSPTPAQTSSSASASPAVTVTDHDSGKAIDLAKGGTLVVQLESNPSTGYSWAVSGDPAPLKLVDSSYKQADQSGKVGAPGIQQIRLEATAPGTSTLKLVYRRPWEKKTPPAKTFLLTVNVR